MPTSLRPSRSRRLWYAFTVGAHRRRGRGDRHRPGGGDPTGPPQPGQPDECGRHIGHSYGTVVIGYAARETAGVAADDIVLVASPGVGVNYAEDLHGPAYGHVWACTYGFDIKSMAAINTGLYGSVR